MAGIRWKNNNSPAALRRRYFAKKKAMEREAAGAIGRAADVLERAVKSRVFPAKAVSQQDAPGKRAITLAGRSPVSTKIDRKNNRARVSLVRHWTTARTRAVTSLFRRFGEEKALFRPGLVVKRTRKTARGQKKGLRRLQGPANEFISFSRDKGLETWAQRREKGEQIRRHVVRLQNPDIIQALQLTPSVKSAEGLIDGIFRDAARRGFRA